MDNIIIMSLAYHDATYLKAIKESSGKAIKEAYSKLARAFEAEKRDFTMIDAEKAYWEEELQADKTLTQKEKDLLTVLEVAYEMYCRGFKFNKVDLYQSDSDKFLIIDNAILPPLRSLQGVGENAAKNIVNAREDGEFF